MGLMGKENLRHTRGERDDRKCLTWMGEGGGRGRGKTFT